MKSMTIGIDHPPGRLSKMVWISNWCGAEVVTEEMTKVDVGNAGQPRLAARGGLGVPLSRGIQHR